MSFTTDITKFCKDIAPESLDKTVRKTVAEIGNRLVMRSPVGDAQYWKSPPPPGYVGGRFRGNWQYGFNSAPSGDIEGIDASGQGTISKITSSMREVSGVHYIVNNLPYAEKIENGWSRQAPEGVVGRVELEFDQIVKQAKA